MTYQTDMACNNDCIAMYMAMQSLLYTWLYSKDVSLCQKDRDKESVVLFSVLPNVCVWFFSGLATLGAQEKLNTFGRQSGQKSIHACPDFTCVNISLCNKKNM